MTLHLAPRSCEAAAHGALVLDAARSWQAARDARQPAMPSLFNVLAPKGLALLTPMFDSLLRLFEATLGRRFATGQGLWISEDELLLLGLVDGVPEDRARDGVAGLLDCALRSARLLLDGPAPLAKSALL